MLKDANMKVQFLACEYMEKTYGKEWQHRIKLSSEAITNAFIDGYRVRDNEEKTATKVIYNRKLFDIVEPQREAIEKLFKLKVEVKDYMPENIIAICNDEMDVIMFIDLNDKN